MQQTLAGPKKMPQCVRSVCADRDPGQGVAFESQEGIFTFHRDSVTPQMNAGLTFLIVVSRRPYDLSTPRLTVAFVLDAAPPPSSP